MSMFSGLFTVGPGGAPSGSGGDGLFSSSSRYRRQLTHTETEAAAREHKAARPAKDKGKKDKKKTSKDAGASISGKSTEKAAKRARALEQPPPEAETTPAKKLRKDSGRHRASAEATPRVKANKKASQDAAEKPSVMGIGDAEEVDASRLVHETLLAPSGREKKPKGTAIAAGAGDGHDATDTADRQVAGTLLDRDDVTNTLFVGNVPLTVTRKALRNLFKSHGEVKSVRIRSLPVKVDSTMSRKAATITGTTAVARSSTNAYVVMATSEGAQAAIALNMTKLEGKHIRVDYAVPRSGTDEAEGAGVSYDPTRTIFIGNLHFEVETEEVIDAIEAAADEHPELVGSLDAVRVVRDPKKNICKGFGFVMFKTKAAARSALSLKGVEVHGRELRVTRLKGQVGGQAGKMERPDSSLRGASKGVAKRTKQESWQGTRVKAGSADLKAKKMRRGAPGASESRGGGKRGRGSAKAQAAAGTGGMPREKGKRPAVALKKAKQANDKDGAAAGSGPSPKKKFARSPSMGGNSKAKPQKVGRRPGKKRF